MICKDCRYQQSCKVMGGPDCNPIICHKAAPIPTWAHLMIRMLELCPEGVMSEDSEGQLIFNTGYRMKGKAVTY